MACLAFLDVSGLLLRRRRECLGLFFFFLFADFWMSIFFSHICLVSWWKGSWVSG